MSTIMRLHESVGVTKAPGLPAHGQRCCAGARIAREEQGDRRHSSAYVITKVQSWSLIGNGKCRHRKQWYRFDVACGITGSRRAAAQSTSKPGDVPSATLGMRTIKFCIASFSYGMTVNGQRQEVRRQRTRSASLRRPCAASGSCGFAH